MNAIRDDIRAEIEQRRWSVNRLATESGVSFGSLARWMHGHGQIGLISLEKVCKALDLSLKIEAIQCPTKP